MAEDQAGFDVIPTPFPAKTRSESAKIKDIETTATSTYFADKIVITISQKGRLAHWVHVPLDIAATDETLTSNSYYEPDEEAPPSDLLPMHHLTATTILGGGIRELDTLGQTLATQTASAVLQRNSGEKRMLVLGMGLDKSTAGRDEFAELVGLVLGVL